MRNKTTNKRQFTLIELIIVIVVIGILAGMALPKFLGVQRNAKVAAMETDLDVIEKAVMQYVTATDDGSYPFLDTNDDKIINEEDLYFKTGTIPQTLTDSLLKASGDDCSKIYKLDMDKLKPYISKIKYPDTEYLYSEKSDTAIDPIGKADGDNFIHHIIGSGNVDSDFTQKEVIFKDVLYGEFQSLSIGSDGNLYGWGDNRDGEIGLGNDITFAISPTLVELPNNTKPKSLAIGELHSLVIGNDGNLYATGYNGSGQLGVGDYEYRYKFEKVTLPSGVKPISVSTNGYYASYVMCDDGNLYVIGDSRYLPPGASIYDDYYVSATIVPFPSGTKPISVKSSYYHTLVLCEDGNVYTWGKNMGGCLGVGDTVNYDTHQKVILPTGVKATSVFLNWATTAILCDDGNLYTCGNNSNGQLGIGINNSTSIPTKVNFPNGVKPKIISLHEYSTAVIGDDDNLYVWGRNYNGQLGIGNMINQYSPTKVTFPKEFKPISVISGETDFFVLGEDGSLYSWGQNSYGQLGLGDIEDRLLPTKVYMPNNIKVKRIDFSLYNTRVLGEDGNIYATGRNENGELGINKIGNQTTFQKVPTIKNN